MMFAEIFSLNFQLMLLKYFGLFQLQKKGKENVKRIDDSFEALNKQKQIKKG